MNSSLTTSIILLLLALVLLWMAVTDKLGRVLDAYDVITGKSTASDVTGVSGGGGATTPVINSTAFKLPSLPSLGVNVQVPAV